MDLGGATSGGASTLTCRRVAATTAAAVLKTGSCAAAGPAIAGADETHALKHFAWSIPLPQQSSAGMVMVMLSHGRSAAWASALVAGPKPSQNDRSATMSVRSLMWGG